MAKSSAGTSTPASKPPARPSAGNPITRSHAVWRGQGLEFEAGNEGRTHLMDGNSKIAASPVETLLGSLAACTGSDVVDILAKQRTPASRFEVDVVATRRAEFPRRVMKLDVTFSLDGNGIDVAQAERAIALSFEKYCTVAASLAGDIELTSVLILNGAQHDGVRHPMFSATFPR